MNIVLSHHDLPLHIYADGKEIHNGALQNQDRFSVAFNPGEQTVNPPFDFSSLWAIMSPKEKTAVVGWCYHGKIK